VIRWRYLTDDNVGAAEGLAVDEALMWAHGRGRTAETAATLRLYTYRPHCALVGRYQDLEDEVDLDYCREHDVQVGRRPTGGGAILMGPGQLGMGLVTCAVPDEPPRKTLRRFAEGVIAGLAESGIEARFRSKNDLEVGGRKIAGLGLHLDSEGAVLFHASVLVDLDVRLLLDVLRIPGAKLADKAITQVEQRVTTISRELGRPLRATAVRAAFGTGFARAFGVDLVPGELNHAERERRDELVAIRYGSPEWIRQRSPRRDARGTSLLKTPEGLLRIYASVHGSVIKSVLVAGDFNVLPPGIPRLEAALRWCGAEPARIAAVAAEALGSDELGVPARSVADAVWEAVARAQELEHIAHPVRAVGSCYFPDPSAPAAAEDARGGKEGG